MGCWYSGGLKDGWRQAGSNPLGIGSLYMYEEDCKRRNNDCGIPCEDDDEAVGRKGDFVQGNSDWSVLQGVDVLSPVRDISKSHCEQQQLQQPTYAAYTRPCVTRRAWLHGHIHRSLSTVVSRTRVNIVWVYRFRELLRTANSICAVHRSPRFVS